MKQCNIKEKKYTSPNFLSYTILTPITSDSSCQSIILSDENQILSYISKPYHSISTFLKDTQWKNVIIQELIHGIPIQLFYDKRIHSWEIATKNAIGGKYLPNKHTKITIYDMFLDALAMPCSCRLNDIPLLQGLSTNYSYIFVLQHPAHLSNLLYPSLYLVSVYSYLQPISPTEYESWDIWKNNTILFPTLIFSDCFVELENKFTYYMKTEFHRGIILSDNTGKKLIMENKTYEKRKKIPDSKIQYQYLCLYRIGKIKDFLNVFPQYKSIFFYWKKKYLDFIKKIHSCYYEVYIKKTVELNQINDTYYIHIWKLHHQIYIPNKKTNKKTKITIRDVKHYMDSYDPHLQLYYMNL
jgi:hypothetical protein